MTTHKLGIILGSLIRTEAHITEAETATWRVNQDEKSTKHCHSIKRKEKSRALMLKRPLLMMMMMMAMICVQSFAQRDKSKTVRTASVRSCVARVTLVSTERGTTPTAAVICAPTTRGPQPLALPRLTIVPSVSHTLMLPMKTTTTMKESMALLYHVADNKNNINDFFQKHEHLT